MNFRLLLSIAGVLMTTVLSMPVLAQTPPRFLKIQVDYNRGDRHTEEAVEYIDATNTVKNEADVEYRAGKSVQLLPGFEAKSGSVFLASLRPVSAEAEKTLRLTAFPNPFEHTTIIEYYLPADGKVNLWITNAQGVRIHQLINDQSKSAGMHHIEWNATTTAQGIYLPVIESNQQRATTKLIKK